MNLIHAIRWEHPEILWGFLGLPLLSYLVWYGWQSQYRMFHFELPSPIKQPYSRCPTRWELLWATTLLLGGFALALLGFASPTWSIVHQEPAWERMTLGLILDVSRSMQAPANPDIQARGSRLSLLQQATQELIGSVPTGVRLGVIAFAGVAVPLVGEPSSDHQAVLAKIRRLDADFIRHPGSALAAAIQQGLALFTETEQMTQPDAAALILLSDGDSTLTAALQEVIQHVTVPIYTIGIGTPHAVLLPKASLPVFPPGRMPQGPLTTTVNVSLLRYIAEQTGGAYYNAAERQTLYQNLWRILGQQRRQILQTVTSARSARNILFFAAFCCLFIYQFQTRSRRR